MPSQGFVANPVAYISQSIKEVWIRLAMSQGPLIRQLCQFQASSSVVQQASVPAEKREPIVYLVQCSQTNTFS